MNNKKIIEENHGTITRIYEIPSKDNKIKEICIVIQCDNPEGYIINKIFDSEEGAKFSVGQRVVDISYIRKRLATKADINKYSERHERCPLIINETMHVTCDELEYEQKMRPSKKR